MSVSSRPRSACKAILRPCAFPVFFRLRFFIGGRTPVFSGSRNRTPLDSAKSWRPGHEGFPPALIPVICLPGIASSRKARLRWQLAFRCRSDVTTVCGRPAAAQDLPPAQKECWCITDGFEPRAQRELIYSQPQAQPALLAQRIFGSECEIRTHERLSAPPVFKAGAINRSANSLYNWSGQLDSNQRSPAPKAGGLNRLSHARNTRQHLLISY